MSVVHLPFALADNFNIIDIAKYVQFPDPTTVVVTLSALNVFPRSAFLWFLRLILGSSMMIFYMTVLPRKVLTGFRTRVPLVLAPITPRRSANDSMTMGLSPYHVVTAIYGVYYGRTVRLALVMG